MSGRSRNFARWTLLVIMGFAVRAVAGTAATDPDPADGAVVPAPSYGMNIYMALYFSPGEGAVSHMGYFSNDYDDVAGRDPAHCLGASPFPHINPTMFFVGFDDPAISAFARAPLERGRTYYWAIDEFDGTTTHAGPVWSFTVMPTKAWNPNPPDGAEDVTADPNLTLTWSLGDVDTTNRDVEYALYYGTDSADVQSSTTPDSEMYYTTHTLAGLADGTEYFWRIDIVLTKCVIPFPVTTIKGDVWSFKTFRTGPAIIYVDAAHPGPTPTNTCRTPSPTQISHRSPSKYALPGEPTDPTRTPITPMAPEIARQHFSSSTE